MEHPPTQPIACSLTSSALRSRRVVIRTELAPRIEEVRDLPGGIALRLRREPDTLAVAEAFVDFEQGCCGFASFVLRIDEDDGAIWIEIDGPPGTAEFLRAELEELIPNATGKLPRRAAAGVLLAVFAVLICQGPWLAVVIGVGGAAAVAPWLDGVAVAMLAASVATVIVWLIRRRRAQAVA